MNENQIVGLSNFDLCNSLELNLERERSVSHTILLHFKEIRRRKLFADLGFSSLLQMLVVKYKQSETAAYQRIKALELMLEVPQVAEGLRNGELNLSTLAMAQRQIKREEKVT